MIKRERKKIRERLMKEVHLFRQRDIIIELDRTKKEKFMKAILIFLTERQTHNRSKYGS